MITCMLATVSGDCVFGSETWTPRTFARCRLDEGLCQSPAPSQGYIVTVSKAHLVQTYSRVLLHVNDFEFARASHKAMPNQ